MAKLLKISKKQSLKREKQKLIERINQCKSLKEIEGWKKTFIYHDVLKDDFDWDYGFFIDLIEFKLKRMREYFYSANITVDDKECGNICNKLINILYAGYKTDIIKSEDLKDTYVNIKNAKRFLNPTYITNKTLYDKYYFAEVRAYKAKALFWKFLHHYIEYLWD